MNLRNKLLGIHASQVLYKEVPGKFAKNALIVLDDFDIAFTVSSVVFLLFGEVTIGMFVFLISLGLLLLYIFLNLRVYDVRPAEERIPDFTQKLIDNKIIDPLHPSNTKLLKKLTKQGRKGSKSKSLIQVINGNALLTSIVGGVIVAIITWIYDAVKDGTYISEAGTVGNALEVVMIVVYIVVAVFMLCLLLMTYTNNRYEEQYFQNDMEDVLLLLESGKDVDEICGDFGNKTTDVPALPQQENNSKTDEPHEQKN